MWAVGQAAEGLRLAQRVIDLADGDPTKQSGPHRVTGVGGGDPHAWQLWILLLGLPES